MTDILAIFTGLSQINKMKINYYAGVHKCLLSLNIKPLKKIWHGCPKTTKTNFGTRERICVMKLLWIKETMLIISSSKTKKGLKKSVFAEWINFSFWWKLTNYRDTRGKWHQTNYISLAGEIKYPTILEHPCRQAPQESDLMGNKCFLSLHYTDWLLFQCSDRPQWGI